MIARFPQPPRRPAASPEAPLVVHSESGETRAEHEESLAWVRWMFQSVRAHCPALTFETEGEAGRHTMIKDWERFLNGRWKQVAAPALIRAWRAAGNGDVDGLLAINDHLDHELKGDTQQRSLEAGALLLKSTQGAKYQGVLGHLRQRADAEGLEIHIQVVWAAVAVVFQLPVADVVAEYLREEWVTATGRYAHHADPQGLLSYAAVSHRTLREANLHGIVGAPSP